MFRAFGRSALPGDAALRPLDKIDGIPERGLASAATARLQRGPGFGGRHGILGAGHRGALIRLTAPEDATARDHQTVRRDIPVLSE